jgi:hypothetical protein
MLHCEAVRMELVRLIEKREMHWLLIFDLPAG